MAEALLRDPTRDFWSEVCKSCDKKTATSAPIVDGISGDTSIANFWRSIFEQLLNTSHTHDADLLLDELDQLITSDNVYEVVISAEVVLESVNRLKRGKSDGGSLFSDHVIEAPAMLHSFLANFFTAILRHGYVTSAFRDAILLPIPKGLKDPSDSSNYRGIALASCVSKVLEWCIILTWSQYFVTDDLQFGFKPGHSTTLCTGTLKAVVNCYIKRSSNVYVCLIDASKAFDTVDHYVLFKKLLTRGILIPIARFLLHWYRNQLVCVRWNGTDSAKFSVSNGVHVIDNYTTG